MQKLIEEVREIRSHAKLGDCIVFISGKFNILHPGHLRLIRFAKECGNFLVVGVLDDSHSDGAFLSEEARLQALQAIQWVDYSFVLRSAPESFIDELKPDVVVKGKEYEDRKNPETIILNKYGGKLLFSSGDSRFSSLDLIRREINEINFSSIEKPQNFMNRHGFSLSDLQTILGNMSLLRVCVIGDLIVDDYVRCDPVGMSQEDPTIVVTPVASEDFIGGAGIVAAHAMQLGASADFITVVGNDNIGKQAVRKLEEYGVDVYPTVDESRPTTHKRRYRAHGKTLLRVNTFRQHQISKNIQETLLSKTFDILDSTDLLIFSDFNYGIIPQQLVEQICAECKKRNIMMIADSQSSSQMGDISRFRGMDIISPTEREARVALRDQDSGLVILAEKLRKKTDTKHVLITLAEEGLLIHAGVSDENMETDRLPALNKSPMDPAGAGDVLLVSTAMAFAAGCSIWGAAYLGSLTAAVQVGRVGNIPIRPEELFQELSF